MTNNNIPTPNELRQLLDYDPDTGSLTWKARGPEWFADGAQTAVRRAAIWNGHHANTPSLVRANAGGYLCGRILGVPVLAHRVAFAHFHGAWPRNEIDHKNGNTTANWIANIRDVSNAENSKNQRKSSANTSGTVGVTWIKKDKRWLANIGHNGSQVVLGRFLRLDDAITARKIAEKDRGFSPRHGT